MGEHSGMEYWDRNDSEIRILILLLMQNIEIDIKNQPGSSSPMPLNIFHPGRSVMRPQKHTAFPDSSQPISSSTITEYRRTQTKQ